MIEEAQATVKDHTKQAAPEAASPTYAMLAGERFISLTTFRKNGLAVETPVWFAATGAILYIFTGSASGKVRRIRHTPQVTLAPCTGRGAITGPTLVGLARRVTDPAELGIARTSLRRKYGTLYRIVMVLGALRRFFPRGAHHANTYIAIDLAG